MKPGKPQRGYAFFNPKARRKINLNLEIVVQRFSVIANVEIEDSSKWIPVCYESMQEIKRHLKEGVDEETNAHRLEVAAAALALYKYTLFNATTLTTESFTAGEMKIKTDPNTSVKMSAKVWQEAKRSISDLIEDEGFVFERITYDE